MLLLLLLPLQPVVSSSEDCPEFKAVYGNPAGRQHVATQLGVGHARTNNGML